jgi:hypothetical protein
LDGFCHVGSPDLIVQENAVIICKGEWEG